MPKKRPVAVFDIDGTIFRSSLLIQLVEELIRRGDFPEDARKMYKRSEEEWVSRTGSYEIYIDKVISTFTKHIQGLPYDTLKNASQEVVRKKRLLRYRYTSKLIQDLKKKGYYVLAISQSPWIVLEDFCKALGFDKVYGRFYEIGSNDRLTGEVREEELIGNKALILKRAVTKENLTLERSVAVGDTEGDIPMLSLVENPICFNPNKKLARVARASGWDIVIERKDVSYIWSTKDNTIRII